MPLAFGQFVRADEIGSAMTGSVDLDVAITCGTIRHAQAPIFRLVAPGNREALTIVSEGDDVLVQSSTRSRRFRLGAPVLRIRDALSSCREGNILGLRLTGGLQNPRVEVGNSVKSGEGLGLASAWAFFVHAPLLTPWMKTTFSLLWLAALVLPLGLVTRAGWVAAICAAFVVAAFALCPAIWRLPTLTLPQTLAVAGAGGVGSFIQRRMREAKSPST